MRTLIRTESDLSVFVDGLKALTLGQMASMFNKTLKHPEAKASVERAIGQKASKTITDRQARDLAANLLGFENAHVMSAHYKSLVGEKKYQPWNIIIEYKGDAVSYMVGIPEGLHPDDLTKPELAAAVSSDYNPFSGHEHLEVFDAFGAALSWEEARKACDGLVRDRGVALTHLMNVTGVGADEEPDVLLADLRVGCFNGRHVDLNCGAIDDCTTHYEKELLSEPEEKLIRVLLSEMEVPESMEEKLSAAAIKKGRFECKQELHVAVVDLRKGYAGYFFDGELSAGFLFAELKALVKP